MFNEKCSLEFFVSEKDHFLVVAFIGTITRSTLSQLERCWETIAKSDARHVVLTFHDVESVEIGGVPGLVKLQMQIRDRRSDLRLCFLRPEIRRSLTEAGAIRDNEIQANLLEALRSFPPAGSEAA